MYPNPKKQNYTILETIQGKDLVGLKYTPLFDYFAEEFSECAFKVVSDSYVTSESGTGIVHQAPGFGEDDFRVCLAHEIITKTNVPCPIDANGRFTKDVRYFTELELTPRLLTLPASMLKRLTRTSWTILRNWVVL